MLIVFYCVGGRFIANIEVILMHIVKMDCFVTFFCYVFSINCNILKKRLATSPIKLSAINI